MNDKAMIERFEAMKKRQEKEEKDWRDKMNSLPEQSEEIEFEMEE